MLDARINYYLWCVNDRFLVDFVFVQKINWSFSQERKSKSETKFGNALWNDMKHFKIVNDGQNTYLKLQPRLRRNDKASEVENT